jgi:hypothetical protein
MTNGLVRATDRQRAVSLKNDLIITGVNGNHREDIPY